MQSSVTAFDVMGRLFQCKNVQQAGNGPVDVIEVGEEVYSLHNAYVWGLAGSSLIILHSGGDRIKVSI